jgi:[acyl-carrier-protein] S-malonyltransferase
VRCTLELTLRVDLGLGGAMNKSITCLLFPGQGSQTAQMRDTVWHYQPDLYRLAVEQIGTDPFELVNEGTQYAQPAIYCASIASWVRLGKPSAEYLAGHSLGELAALVAAGCISSEDGLRLVCLRGRVMEQADTDGGMLAVSSGKSDGKALDLAQPLAQRFGVGIANDNSWDQVVLSGPNERLHAAAAQAKSEGIRTKMLPVKGAFHSQAMQGAVVEFEQALADVSFAKPQGTVLSASTAQPFDDIPLRLSEGLVRPVRFRETLLHLRELGVGSYVEVGPGKVLTGLVRRTLSDVEATAGDQLEAVGA